jgi:hypothetical protein
MQGKVRGAGVWEFVVLVVLWLVVIVAGYYLALCGLAVLELLSR